MYNETEPDELLNAFNVVYKEYEYAENNNKLKLLNNDSLKQKIINSNENIVNKSLYNSLYDYFKTIKYFPDITSNIKINYFLNGLKSELKVTTLDDLDDWYNNMLYYIYTGIMPRNVDHLYNQFKTYSTRYDDLDDIIKYFKKDVLGF